MLMPCKSNFQSFFVDLDFVTPLHILPEYIQATVICGIDSEASLMTIIDGFVSFIDVPLQLPIIREAGVG